MKIHEYQAKDLLAAAGANVPAHIVVTTPDEAAAAFDKLGGTGAMVKAQIHAGGRGAGQLKGYADKLGGVKYAPTREKAKALAAAMLAHSLITKQTGPEGQPIKTLIIQADAEPVKEFYVAVVLDRATGVPILMASAEGGMDIEEVAHHHPEKIIRVPISPEAGLQPFQARRLAYELGFTGDQVAKAEKIMLALAKVYLEKDATLAEINPLAVTKKGDVVVLDAKFDFDDNALFRHKDIAALRDLNEENPAEVRAGKANLNFIQLDGTIGCLVNGAGLAMATMDVIQLNGGSPANFLDVGGGATKERVTEAFKLILSSDKVKAIFVNIFGGIVRCDMIAEGIIAAVKEVDVKVPVIVRLEGTNVEKGKELLANSGLAIQPADNINDGAKKAVAAAA